MHGTDVDDVDRIFASDYTLQEANNMAFVVVAVVLGRRRVGNATGEG